MIDGVSLSSLLELFAAFEEFIGPYEVMRYCVILVLNVSEHIGDYELPTIINKRSALHILPFSFSTNLITA